MRLLLLVILILSTGCASDNYYKIPKGGKNYIVQREIVGYQCPDKMYLDMRSFTCQVDKYLGYIEMDSTTLTIPRNLVVTKYDTDKIKVRRNE